MFQLEASVARSSLRGGLGGVGPARRARIPALLPARPVARSGGPEAYTGAIGAPVNVSCRPPRPSSSARRPRSPQCGAKSNRSERPNLP
jgi:hypothetical protein